ncbi:hypothetical protein [Succinimonas sp.]|uniref:hypothetical protein n=1 Tax=Succinimonas sp. TaxID=1936151 RepID=UPI0038671E84
MTYDEFWNQDVRLVEVYRKANELREKRRNREMWLQGMYFYEALCDASPLFRFSMKKGSVKPEPYAKEPYPITAAEIREREEREARRMQEQLKADFARFAEQMQKKMSSETHPGIEGGEKNVYND